MLVDRMWAKKNVQRQAHHDSTPSPNPTPGKVAAQRKVEALGVSAVALVVAGVVVALVAI